MKALLDAVIFDIGGTLVREAPLGTAIPDLLVEPLGNAESDLRALGETVRIGAATDTSVMTEADVRGLLTDSGIAKHLEAIATSADVGAPKPDPATLNAAMDRLGLTQRSRVLYVGNLDIDEQAANAAGVHYQPIGADGPLAAVTAWLDAHAGSSFRAAVGAVQPINAPASAAATERHEQLTKPSGALGRVEALGIQLAGMSGHAQPPEPFPAAVAVFAGDHGVLDEGISPWPQAVTAMMVGNFARGGAAINVLARLAAVDVVVVDVGVATPIDPHPDVRFRNVRRGTRNVATGPAMTLVEARAALDVGADLAASLVADGYRCLLTGDMGIGNTTPSAALIAAFTGGDPAVLTGRGTGIDDERLAHKTEIVTAAVRRANGSAPLDVLADIGGLEIAALAGYIVGGAAAGVPVLIDGVIALAAAVTAEQLCPGVREWLIAGHRSTEPAATAALTYLDLAPIIDLDLRLGEGTGAALAYPIVRSAAAVLRDMATFSDLGIES